MGTRAHLPDNYGQHCARSYTLSIASIGEEGGASHIRPSGENAVVCKLASVSEDSVRLVYGSLE